jgi:autotransporter strand-loop-strand O-heptosyltransferase
MKTLIKLNTKALGDNIGAMPCAEAYQAKTGEDVYVYSNWKHILQKSYPSLKFVDAEDGEYEKIHTIKYLFERPLQEGFASQLGFDDWTYVRPKVDPTNGPRPVKGKYVAIGMQSTAQCKYWNYSDGWNLLCKKLRKAGLTPVCIDQYESFGIEGHWNLAPSASVKRLNNPIEETINYIQHAEFFVGISSGLSWVAHGLGKRVVMISGVTMEWNEFDEDCLRIINKEVCHGCINKTNLYRFDAGDWLWCPVLGKSSRRFECTSTITPEHVMDEIRKVGYC